MYAINRQVAIIKPKKPYVDWINTLPEMAEDPMEMEELETDCTAILIPYFDDEEESMEHIKSIHSDIFEIELEGWSGDEDTWPPKRNYALFNKWFKVEIHSEVIDLIEDDIEKEEY